MKISLNLLVLFFTATFSINCFTQESKEMSKMEEVMVRHDEAMSKMSTIVTLINKLQTNINSETCAQICKSAINALKDSNQSMMNWMNNFGKRFTADEMLKGKKLSKEKEKWILEELVKVKNLQIQINSSIEQAEKALK